MRRDWMWVYAHKNPARLQQEANRKIAEFRANDDGEIVSTQYQATPGPDGVVYSLCIHWRGHDHAADTTPEEAQNEAMYWETQGEDDEEEEPGEGEEDEAGMA